MKKVMTKLKMLTKEEKKGMDGPEVSFCWNFWLWRLVHQLFAILLVVAGASQSYTDRGPSDCYFIGRGSNSCSPGHVNGLVFYLYVNIFLLQFPLLSVFEASRMSGFVPGIDFADRNINEELGNNVNRKIQGRSIRLPKTNPKKNNKPGEQR